MVKSEKRGKEGSTRFENLEDKRNFFGKIKSFLMTFSKFYLDDKSKNSAHKL